MKKWFQVSLQTKIVGLSAALIITVIVLLASIFSYMQFVESKRQAEQLALQAAKSISFMPEVKAAFQKKQPAGSAGADKALNADLEPQPGRSWPSGRPRNIPRSLSGS